MSYHPRRRPLKNRFKFNGIEHEDALDLNIEHSFFRMLDPAIGRWWQLDPKPREDISLYAAMGNNPILYSDPLGDTTWVYSSTGALLHTINDKRKNQIHFMTEEKFSAMGRNEGENDHRYSKRIRAGSSAFIGENTTRDMELIAGVSNAFALEFGFVGNVGKDREIRLQMLDRDGSNEIRNVNLSGQK